jgi:tellurite resistance protein TerC
MWMSGYMLEWMLSFDNLFVFHMIFSTYGTPEHLKHRPLYMGIVGAIFFRLIFIFIGEYLMHAMVFVHFIFGAFLVYTGVKTVIADDEDDDPSQQPAVQWLQRNVPFVPAYDEKGAFFVRVPVDEHGTLLLPDVASTQKVSESSPLVANTSDDEAGEQAAKYGTVNFGELALNGKKCDRYELRATMLFLVVCCLEISDLLFAVDSVSAIVAQVPDLFLAYTSAVFAMLGLRATFFIIDVLVQIFTLLKYGVGAVLVFVGVKLIASHIYHVPPSVVCIVLVTCVGSSMVASVVQDRMEKAAEAKLTASKI